jgi:solute carrier family 25 (mitochondrial folate transporter), member 32
MEERGGFYPLKGTGLLYARVVATSSIKGTGSEASLSFASQEVRGFMRSLSAGAGAGAICTCLCAPLDIAKVRTQVQGSTGRLRYRGLVQTLNKIWRDEGLAGLYKGLVPALCTVPLFWGIYWTSYEKLKLHYAQEYPDSSPHLHHIGAAVTAGAIGDVITNPFWGRRHKQYNPTSFTKQHT